MEQYIEDFSQKAIQMLGNLPKMEIAKAMNILQAAYERDGRIYVVGNGGSLALATHWVADFNKTVFSHNLDDHQRRFQAIRLPTTEEELTAWGNDVGYEMVFAGPLRNYIQDSDVLIAISSSGNSENIIRAVELSRSEKVPVIGISGFDGGRLNPLSDAKILVPSAQGEYELVEGIHAVILHIFTRYFKDYFDYVLSLRKDNLAQYSATHDA
ncbi:MAG: SIS domain-containing protein [Terracidiphilus sp.]|nr:SIS domain-containing protein [Terracidiphilus sp.]